MAMAASSSWRDLAAFASRGIPNHHHCQNHRRHCHFFHWQCVDGCGEMSLGVPMLRHVDVDAVADAVD